ncbi:MAG: hypothetical protein KQH57_08485 [Actinomycetales bacterium]|nr:hypothetical protein [Actinomycetales bacterium]
MVDYIARLEQANADLLAQGLAEREQHAASARIWRRVCTALTVLVVLAALEPVWARVVGL